MAVNQNATDVTRKHPEWEKRKPQWERMRDVIEGEDAVKDKTTLYLPPINSQDTQKVNGRSDYDIYLNNAEFYNTTGLTFEAFIGMIFRKNPVIGDMEPETVMNDTLLNNVDLEGTDIHTFIRDVSMEVNRVGRAGILVDYPTNEELELTKTEAERLNIRRYLKIYKTESIINWKYKTVNGVRKLICIVLEEEIEDDLNLFGHDTKKQYRVLRINEEGRYVQETYVESQGGGNNTKEYEKTEADVYFDGEQLTEIPFIVINSLSIGMETEKPALLDMANTNLKHYISSASLGSCIHMFARSTPIFEVPAQYWEKFRDQEIEYGVTKHIIIPTTGDGAKAGAGFLEPTKSADLVVNNMDRLEGRMAAQGARMLTPQKKGVESADTVRMDMSGELSILSSIVNNISKGLSMAVSMLRGEDTHVDMNSDFLTLPIDAGMITSLLMALQAGRISEPQFIDALVRGEAIKPESTITTDVEFTPSPDETEELVPEEDGELEGREENVENGEPLNGPNGEENRV